MNKNDVVDVLSAIAVGDRRTVGQNDVELWNRIIGHLRKDLALQAVVDHFRECPGVWLEPGHIAQRVGAISRDSFERAEAPAIAAFDGEHYPGDTKAAPDFAPYPAEWDSNQRLSAYWYALRMHAMPQTTAGWKALATQLKRQRKEREAS